MSSCCRAAYKLKGKKCPMCNKSLIKSNMVVQLAASGEEGPALAITIADPVNETVQVMLDGRFYVADGNDDGIREVPLDRVSPVWLPSETQEVTDAIAKFYEE